MGYKPPRSEIRHHGRWAKDHAHAVLTYIQTRLAQITASITQSPVYLSSMEGAYSVSSL